jgi:hypothetical protein
MANQNQKKGGMEDRDQRRGDLPAGGQQNPSPGREGQRGNLDSDRDRDRGELGQESGVSRDRNPQGEEKKDH